MTDRTRANVVREEDSAAIARDGGAAQFDLSVMKITNRLGMAVLVVGLSAGCANDAGNGALIGGGVGALAGGIIGNQSGHSMGGALIGGAIGAGTGALIGHASDENKIDKQKQYDRGYDDARSDASYRSPAPSSGYYSSSETSRSSIGSGGYSNSRTVTQTSSTSTTYYR